jgi:anion-transporting  ArsA/GET3 family ATPase
MRDLLGKAKVIICVGSGGVGKTTVSSALALRAAQMGRKVLVLTVDPAKRLKSTMGLESLDQSKIEDPSITGSLTAAVIDNKKIFDDFVNRVAGETQSKEKILKNKLYIQLSTTLSGSQEFTALEKLYSSFQSGKYDLIVLDTPPAQHAIDFLGAPKKLAFLFSEKITKWFRISSQGEKIGFFASIIQTGTRQVVKALEILTGSEFIRELADFFQNIQQWQGQIEQRILRVNELLLNPGTHFVLVTSFDEAKLKEANSFLREITKGGHHLSWVIINRAYPKGLDLNLSVEGKTDLDQLYLRAQSYYALRDKGFREFAKNISTDVRVLRLPEIQGNISDLQDVVAMARNIEEVLRNE